MLPNHMVEKCSAALAVSLAVYVWCVMEYLLLYVIGSSLCTKEVIQLPYLVQLVLS